MAKKSKFGVNVGKKAKIVIEWKDKAENYSYEAKKNIIAIVSDRYDIPKESVKVNFFPVQYNEKGEQIDISTDVITNIQDPKFQIKLFSEYIVENKIDDVDFEFIKKIDSEINSKIDYDVYEKYKKYEIEWIKWDNFQSYGPDNFFDFRLLNGLTLVNGYPGNMSGKSSFTIDLISFLLFGKSQKPYTLSECFNKFTDEKEFRVFGGIKIDEGHYVIERTVTRSKKRTGEWGDASQTVKYYEVINENKEELLDETNNESGEHAKKTNKIIKESIGTEKDFNMIISASANDLDSLIDIGSTERGRLLSKWIGLFPLEEKDRVAKETYKEFEKPLKSKTYNETDLENDNKIQNESITNNNNLILVAEKRVIELNDLVLKENQTKDSLLQSKKKVDPNILKLDISTVNTKIKNITNDGRIKAEELELKKKEYKDVENANFSDDKYKELIEIDKKYSLELNDLKNEINTLKTTNKNLLESESCPTCKRKYAGADNSKIISENEKKIEGLIKKGLDVKNIIDTNKDLITKMDQEKIRFDKKLKLTNLIEIIPIQLENLRGQLREQKQLIKEHTENKEAIDLNNSIDISLTNTNAKIKSYETERFDKIKVIENLKRNIEENVKTISKNNLIIAELKEEFKKIRNWKVYLDMVGKNGISKMVLRKTLPIINSELARILDDVCDFDIEVILTDKNEVIFKIIKDGIASNLAGASGFERTASALALRCVLGNISTMPRPNFITLDEILGKVAKEFYDNIKNLYAKVENNYQFILHIAHIEEIKDWHRNTITISKESNISNIKTIINSKTM